MRCVNVPSSSWLDTLTSNPSLPVTAVIDEVFNILHTNSARPTDVHRGQMSRIEKFVELGTADGQGLTCLCHRQKNFRWTELLILRYGDFSAIAKRPRGRAVRADDFDSLSESCLH